MSVEQRVTALEDAVTEVGNLVVRHILEGDYSEEFKTEARASAKRNGWEIPG